MSGPDPAFSQMRQILNRLDRSIDDARARRLNPEEAAESAPAPQASPTPSAPEQPSPNAAAESEKVLSENAKLYGRARPIRPSGFDAANKAG